VHADLLTTERDRRSLFSVVVKKLRMRTQASSAKAVFEDCGKAMFEDCGKWMGTHVVRCCYLVRRAEFDFRVLLFDVSACADTNMFKSGIGTPSSSSSACMRIFCTSGNISFSGHFEFIL